MANHKPKKWEWQGKPYEVQAGQLITSLPSIVEKCHCKSITVQKVRTALTRFKNLGFSTDNPTNKNRLITIVNWQLYQDSNEENNRQDNRQITGNQQADNRQITSNKNVKNDKNDKNILTISNDIVSNTDVQQVIEMWNKLESFGIISVKRISSGSKRYNSLVARIKQYGLSDVLVAVENIKQSPFLQGKNDTGWTVTFDWFVKPNNFVKVLEGNYASRDNTKSVSVNVPKGAFNNYNQKIYTAEEIDEIMKRKAGN